MDTESRITVKGKGLVTTPPDKVVINLAVTGFDWEYSKSVERLNEKVESIRKSLEAVGLDRKQLKTIDFDVDPVHEYEKKKNVFKGYKASHDLRIKIDFDQKLLNQVLNSLVETESGASFSLSFQVSDTEEVQRKVLEAAVEDAKTKANILAHAAGKELGEIVLIHHSWSEIMFSSTYHSYDTMSVSEATPMMDIEPDDVRSSDTVEVVWGLA
jgi:uncharacterized protein